MTAELFVARRATLQKSHHWLLLGEAVKRAKSPDQFAAINPNDMPSRKKLAQD